MQVIENIAALRNIIKEIKKKNLSVGLVPTMGFLHAGHLSLMEAAKKDNDFLVVSIFVNPLQFGVGEDYAEYPRDLEGDLQQAAATGCDLIFSPAVKEMYPRGYATFVEVERLTDSLCGFSRPGHFRGVTTVVAKLFNLVCPDRAYFGQKDAQQAFVLKKMVADLNMNLELVVRPTVRETDGLAMSSRNKYLTPEQRKKAVVLIQSLREAEEMIAEGEREPGAIKQAISQRISATQVACLDYAEVVDTDELCPVTVIKGKCLIAVAVRFGQTRLIDNVIVEV